MRSGPNAEPSAQEGWLAQGSASFAPMCGQWALLPAFARGDAWTRPRGVWAGRESSFSCPCLVHPLVCVPSAEIQGQTLCSEAVGLCLQEREQTAGGQSGAAQEGKTVARRLPVRVAKLETLDT